MFEEGKIYNFKSISTITLKNEYRNYKYVANVGFEQLKYFSNVFTDVVTIRQKLVLETGKQLLNSKDVRYRLFESVDGDLVCLAYDWIDDASIALVNGMTVEYKFTGLSDTDLTNINNLLNSKGYSYITTIL